MTNISPEAAIATRHLLSHCGSLAAGERVMVIVDATTASLAAGFTATAEQLGAACTIATVDVADRHGKEPPSTVAEQMAEFDLVLGLTKMSMAHTRARLDLNARGGRYLSLPGYSAEMLLDQSITADYHAQLATTQRITDAFTSGSRVRVTGPAGTDITLDIRGRVGNCCPGFVNRDFLLGSPPDIEANVSPIEDASNGVVVVDGSVTADGVGLLTSTVTLQVVDGMIRDVQSADVDVAETIGQLLASVGSPKAYVLAECGVGLNPKARLTGNMLSDEGTLGCVHFGFGSNSTVGGRNDVPFHVDFVFRDASVWVDDECILDAGKPVGAS